MKKNKSRKIKNVLKVVIVALMAIGVAFSALAPIFASEGSDFDYTTLFDREDMLKIKQEVKDDLDDFENEIREIVAEINAIPDYQEKNIRVSGVPSGFSFNDNLMSRARGDAVRYLQILLNTDPATRVAHSGAGSPGRETDLFGDNTRSALMRFQRKYGIPATGNFYQQTREKANELLRAGIKVKDSTEEERVKLQGELRSIATRLGSVREKIDILRKIESMDYLIEECKKEIKEARDSSYEMMCTSEFREMKCQGVLLYGAKNGCEISFLERQGWK